MKRNSMLLRHLLLPFLAFAGGCRAATPGELPGVVNHWVANSGGTFENHVANFLTDMVLYNSDQATELNPLLLTASFWDEGSCGYCSYSTAREGAQVGKAEWWRDTIHSDRAWYRGMKCEIVNFWGRNFLHNDGPPPKGDSAPFVACANGDTLRSVVDPTALAFDSSGHLLVADNGPDQNIKIFSLDPPKLVRTFGDSGGVFARSRPGARVSRIPGQAGDRRFWGIRGLAVDSHGNLYVGNTGIPMQTMGGTDIRAFSPESDSAMLWQSQGLSFVNSSDADPASDGRDLYLNAKRFRMDYSHPPGESWSLSSVTLDPFRFPKDPRLTIPMESVWVRRIQGRRFQYHTNMVGGFVYVVRFDDSSEIGIPTAFICARDDRQTGWGSDSAPSWERTETNKRLRWFWVDRNGDGIAQKAEFATWENWNIYSQAIDVDEEGDIWFGGAGKLSQQFAGGGTSRIAAGRLDANGVPRFRADSVERFDIPYATDNGSALRLKHLSEGDIAFLASGPNAWYPSSIHRYDRYTDSSRRRAVCTIELGYDDLGQSEIHLDRNTAGMTLPWTFTADSEYVYVAYLDNGRYTRRRGEVTVYGARDCRIVGWMAPGEVTGKRSGAVDLVNGINVAIQSDGHRIVQVEEDGAGKVMVYRWCPDGSPCSGGPSPKRGGIEIRRVGSSIEVRGIEGSRLDLHAFSGRRLWSGSLKPTTPDGWQPLPTNSHGLLVARLRLPDGTLRHDRIFAP